MIWKAGEVRTSPLKDGVTRTQAWLDGVNRLEGVVGAREFVLRDAEILFSVSQTTVSLSVSQGSLEGTNFVDGQTLATVDTSTLRTLTGSVRVPDDSALWTNPNQLITITGISDTQEATVTAGSYRYVNSGAPIVTPTSVTEIGPWMQDPNNPTPADQRFLNEIRIDTVTTTTVTTQFQIGVCDFDTCSGARNRTVQVGAPVVTTTNPENFRGNTTLNPDFQPPFTQDMITITTSIIASTGRVVVGAVFRDANQIVIFDVTNISPASYPIIPEGGASITHTGSDGVSFTVTGTIPDGFFSAGDSLPTYNYVDVSVLQAASPPVAPVLTQVSVVNLSSFPPQTLQVDVNRSGVIAYRFDPSVSVYNITARTAVLGGSTTISGTGLDFTSTGSLGRLHTVTATNAAGSDSITFRVIT